MGAVAGNTDKINVVFDDGSLVPDSGLLLVSALVSRLGLRGS